MIELFDAQAGFGGGRRGQPWVPTVHELRTHMERLSIARALVRTEFEEMDREPVYSNRLLYEACAEHGDLVPCPAVMPTGHGAVPSESEQIDEALAHGAGAVTLRPGTDSWSLAPWCCGTLLGLLEEKRIPVLCRASAVDFDQVADLAGRHPGLPIVIFQLGYRSLRTLFSLMGAFDNVYLSVGSPWSVHLGIESLSARVGAERLLFGGGFPYSEPMAGVTMLTYAEVSDADKQLIGAGNLDRLIGGIRR
jgi:predicted TIM-barrel fold metal-dependent hydrolase